MAVLYLPSDASLVGLLIDAISGPRIDEQTDPVVQQCRPRACPTLFGCRAWGLLCMLLSGY